MTSDSTSVKPISQYKVGDYVRYAPTRRKHGIPIPPVIVRIRTLYADGLFVIGEYRHGRRQQIKATCLGEIVDAF
jgi:hypothetical protein